MGGPRTVHAHEDWALHVAVGRCGGVLSTGLDNAYLDGTVLPLPGRALQCALSADGKQAALALRDGTVRVYDRAARTMEACYTGPYPEACGVALAQSTLASCYTSGSRHAVVLRGDGGESTESFDGVGRCVSLDASGTVLAYIAADDEACIANAEHGPAAITRRIKAHGDVGLSLDACGRLVTVADADTLRIVDVRTGSELKMPGYNAPGKYGRCSITLDGRRVVAAEAGGFGVWEIGERRRLATLRTGTGGFCMGCAIAPDGDTVVTAATDGQVRQWGLVGNFGKFIRARETLEELRWWKFSNEPIVRCS